VQGSTLEGVSVKTKKDEETYAILEMENVWQRNHQSYLRGRPIERKAGTVAQPAGFYEVSFPKSRMWEIYKSGSVRGIETSSQGRIL
jgi:hypothetical protein